MKFIMSKFLIKILKTLIELFICSNEDSKIINNFICFKNMNVLNCKVNKT